MLSIASLVDMHIVAAKGGKQRWGWSPEKGGGVRVCVRVDVTNVGTLRWGEVSWLVKGALNVKGRAQSYSGIAKFRNARCSSACSRGTGGLAPGSQLGGFPELRWAMKPPNLFSLSAEHGAPADPEPQCRVRDLPTHHGGVFGSHPPLGRASMPHVVSPVGIDCTYRLSRRLGGSLQHLGGTQ